MPTNVGYDWPGKVDADTSRTRTPAPSNARLRFTHSSIGCSLAGLHVGTTVLYIGRSIYRSGPDLSSTIVAGCGNRSPKRFKRASLTVRYTEGVGMPKCVWLHVKVRPA